MKKFSELAALSTDELIKQKNDARKMLFESRFKKAVHQLNDTAVFGRSKHLIAQIETVLKQRELAQAKESP